MVGFSTIKLYHIRWLLSIFWSDKSGLPCPKSVDISSLLTFCSWLKKLFKIGIAFHNAVCYNFLQNIYTFLRKLCFFPYGVYIEEIGQWRQATVFYESALNLALLTAMLICYPHFRRKGYLLPFYMIGYGTIRLFVEGLRSDSLYLLPGIRVSQVLSGCLIILCIVILFIIRKRQEVRQ